MPDMQAKKDLILLAVVDAVLLLLITLSGYLMHYAGVEAFSLRWMSTFLPLCLAWAASAGLAGLFRVEKMNWFEALWRATLAGALAAPAALMLRGYYLSAAIQPIFMLAMTGMTALVMGVWRAAWAGFRPKISRYG